MKNNTDLRKIHAVYWPDNENESGRVLFSGPEWGDLFMVNEFHGQYDEDWIVQIKDDVEVARHNPRFAETILWEK